MREEEASRADPLPRPAEQVALPPVRFHWTWADHARDRRPAEQAPLPPVRFHPFRRRVPPRPRAAPGPWRPPARATTSYPEQQRTFRAPWTVVGLAFVA